MLQINDVRSLIRFSYDYQNLRCESKDLSISLKDPPISTTIQLVDVTLTDSEIKEIPRPVGIKFSLKGADLISTESIQVPSGMPFKSENSTPKINHFSASLDPTTVTVAFGPWENFNLLVETALRKVIDECVTKKVCKSVTLAVSSISDPSILTLLDQATAAHLPLDVIVNGATRIKGPNSTERLIVKHSPWFWLKGNSLLGPFHEFYKCKPNL